MRHFPTIFVAILCFTALAASADSNPVNCQNPEGLTLQVLGSGGPIADDGRASSGYLLWIDGKSRFLIDAGAGTFLRFGEATAQFEDLYHIAISHFHTDHSTDLSALLKSGYFSRRTNPLSISGPAGGGDYPGLDEYLKRLLDVDKGAYAYLGGYLNGTDGLVKLETNEVDHKAQTSTRVFSDSSRQIEVFALGVPHGPVPALAYRIRVGKQSIVFSGDQNGNAESFIKFAHDADVLVMHMPVPENIGSVGRKLHAPPSVIGKIAAESGARKLILSHFMARSLDQIDENLKQIRIRYNGSLVNAHDLDCVRF